MPRLSLGKLELNIWVIAGMLLLAVVLGVLNNFRVFEEQRVPWLGNVAEEESIGDTEANP